MPPVDKLKNTSTSFAVIILLAYFGVRTHSLIS